MNRLAALRAVLALVCAAHLVLGAIAFAASPGFVTTMAASTYGASVTMTPQLHHAVRILGAFMLAIGILAGFAFQDPRRNVAIVYGIAILQLLRVAQRLVFAAEVHEVFGVSYARLFAQSAFFLALALALFLLRPSADGAPAAGPRA